MESIVVLWSLICSLLVHNALGRDNRTVLVDMQSRCKAVNGLKTVNILWRPLPSQESDWPFDAAYYRVFFRTDIARQTEEYQFGCSANITQQSYLHQSRGELQCTIASQDVFQFQFYYVLKMTNSSGLYVSTRKTCRLVTNVRCSMPQNFTVVKSGRRNLSVSWKPGPYMGRQTDILCYRILYASAQGRTNESVEIGVGKLAYTFYDLLPHTQYSFFIQCGLVDCVNGWGSLSGPIRGMTSEGVPEKAPAFENWSIAKIEDDKRDVTVVWKLPPSNTWNGILRKFQIDFWQVLTQENDSLIPIQNSSRKLQIKNGSVTTTTLPALQRFADYQSQISMCTTQGCGPGSNPWLLKGDPKPTKPQHNSEANNSSVIWIIVATIIGLFVLIAVIVIASWKCKRSRQKNIRLEDLVDPGIPPVYEEMGDSVSTQNSYATIRHEDPARAPLRSNDDLPPGCGGD